MTEAVNVVARVDVAYAVEWVELAKQTKVVKVLKVVNVVRSDFQLIRTVCVLIVEILPVGSWWSQ